MTKRKRDRRQQQQNRPQPTPPQRVMGDPSELEKLPASYQEVHDFFKQFDQANPFSLRKEAFLRIEKITGIPLICYVVKTHDLDQVQALRTGVHDSDLVGFEDLVNSTEGAAIDVFIVSNGGSAEAAERIVRLLRGRFDHIRFIVPANAYSAATLICLSGDEIIMSPTATLGPIDPQVNGVPARAIKRGFEKVEERLKNEGPQALTAYLPLIQKYDLHLLEICDSVMELSKELARDWLRDFMKCTDDDDKLAQIVEYFSSYDIHKSHGRSIDRETARAQGLKVIDVEKIEGLTDLVRGLYSQYKLWFDRTPFFKMFENARGISWGNKTSMQLLKPA